MGIYSSFLGAGAVDCRSRPTTTPGGCADAAIGFESGKPTGAGGEGVIGERGEEEGEQARAFLEKWYAAQLWGRVKTRRPLLCSEMVRRRLESGFFRGNSKRRRRKHSDLAGACMGLSVARQPNMWPLLRSLPEDMRVPVLYVAGALDPKYGGASSSMSPSPRSGVSRQEAGAAAPEVLAKSVSSRY